LLHYETTVHCIKQYVLGLRWKIIITMTNNLTEMILIAVYLSLTETRYIIFLSLDHQSFKRVNI